MVTRANLAEFNQKWWFSATISIEFAIQTEGCTARGGVLLRSLLDNNSFRRQLHYSSSASFCLRIVANSDLGQPVPQRIS